MYERTIQSAVRYLASVPGRSAAIRDVWSSVRSEARAARLEECSLADFTALLDADTRFALTAESVDPDNFEAPVSDDEKDMVALGFNPECSVRLRTHADEEEGEDMPTIVHRHLSETKPVTAKRRSRKVHH